MICNPLTYLRLHAFGKKEKNIKVNKKMHKDSINMKLLDPSPLKIVGLSINPCYHWG